MIPSTQDMATSLEQADGDKVDGTDFEIQDYTSTDVNGIGVYTYTTKMLNTEKSNGKPVCDPQGYRKRFRILQHRSIC